MGLLAPAWLVLGCAPGAPADADSRPNIVFLLSDDQRVGTLGCEGHPWSRTPALDRLAAEGVRFANAFVTTSLCSPARASFLTGMYARRHRVLGNMTYLSPEVPSLATALSAAGYDSIYVGKYHMADQPTRPGFGRSASYPSQGEYHDCAFVVDGALVASQGWVDDVATDYALDFLREERSRPFLLCLGFKAAHGPPLTPPGLDQLYAGASLPAPLNADHLPPFPRKRELRNLMGGAKVGSQPFTTPEHWAGAREERALDPWQSSLLEASGASRLTQVENWLTPELADYYRQVHSVDRNVGRVLATLDELGLTENTVVVYASDNGLLTGEHGLRFKRAAYESSMRVPLLLRYPRLVEGGRVLDAMALNIDLAPTLLDLAGVEISAQMQGASWRGLLEGTPGAREAWRDAFLYEYIREWEYFTPSLFAARTEDWKLVRYPGYESWTELFDLRADPEELHNLAADPAHAQKLEEMTALLGRLQKAAGPRQAAVR